MSDYLKDVNMDEAQDVLKLCQQARQINRFGNKGMTRDKTQRMVSKFPISWALNHPEYSKYFDPNMDQHERRKALYKLCRMFPQFMVVDKL